MNGLREDEQKTFVRLVDSLTGRHNRWQVWKDMIVMFACAISNAVDVRHMDEREELYMDTIKHYSKAEQETFAELFGQMVNAMEHGGHRDFLGELFMLLGLGNDAGGQFFTPYNVCRMMAEVGMPDTPEKVAQSGWVSINDCACGAGATLIAAADVMWHEQHVNYQQSALFIGQDIDYTTALMCYIQLSLYGMPGYVHIGNTLSAPMTGTVLFGDGGPDTWYTPMYFSGVWEGRRQAARLDAVLHSMGRQSPQDTAQTPPEEQSKHEEPPVIRVTAKKAVKKTKQSKPEQVTLWEVME